MKHVRKRASYWDRISSRFATLFYESAVRHPGRLYAFRLRAWLRGERDRMHVVHVPSPQDEASRQLMRDRGELQKEVQQHRDRMRKLLATLGCWDEVDHKHFAGRLARDEGKCHDGAPLPPELRERLLRECGRLALGGAR